ncbi:MAG TPA: polyprenyl synthetase family protein [Egibacteraceae bacterium]|nr:polyprenyl synthetase family protein [Egibacteraceae bacterium]
MAISQAAIDDLARRGAEQGVDLRPGLALVEDRLRTQIAADLPFVEHASRYLMDAGGKRFRPMLVLLSGLLSRPDATDDALVSAGVIVELVHLSTLYHDDVMDAADIRRGLPAAHMKWSNTVAILTGDFLLARASELSAALGVEVTRIMARTIADLCQGQIREVQGSSEAQLHGAAQIIPDQEHYLKVIGEKTASLISASCRLGGLLSGQDPARMEALSRYGWHLGMSFQLADDLLDIDSRSTESGKVPGTDLREGVRTLPVLLALAEDGEDSELARLIDDPTEDNVMRALKLLREHPALEVARSAARLEAAKAKSALAPLGAAGQESALKGLAYLADYAAERVS